MKNAISWFEIPAKDFERSKKFYETVLQAEMNVMDMESTGGKWGFLPFDMEGDGVGGAIVQNPGYEPSQNGVLIYLNGGDDLADALSRVKGAGGKIEMPKSSIGENGFMAIFIDTEGNKIALHSRA